MPIPAVLHIGGGGTGRLADGPPAREGELPLELSAIRPVDESGPLLDAIASVQPLPGIERGFSDLPRVDPAESLGRGGPGTLESPALAAPDQEAVTDPFGDSASFSLVAPIEEPSLSSSEEDASPNGAAPVAAVGKPVTSLSPVSSDWATRRRSWDLELIARQADRHTRRGCELAEREALFSARLEFIRALRLISQGLDAESHTNRHSKALAAGLRAMDEAEDFLPRRGRLEADLDLATIIGSHATPVLKDVGTDRIVPVQALREYLNYAQEQLAAAAGQEVAGSIALQSLGKLYVIMGGKRAETVVAAEPKAMACLQAALIVSPRNYMASNELGVLLARGGRYAEARSALRHSLSIVSTPEAWWNLALSCEQLGLMNEAYWAARQNLAMRHSPDTDRTTAPGAPDVRWVDPQVFAGMTQQTVPPQAARRDDDRATK